ncbi:hypothetical protein [Streptomyces sp. NRRL F-5123]|uniref:hypothetical protein n=1 Tax=Streptomyces sp. NRRL F-5123 TaxID=1463856 RepID=UPI000A6B5710|nr:hypothetical protein [Streptomyces sp. NRRL F-5123]
MRIAGTSQPHREYATVTRSIRLIRRREITYPVTTVVHAADQEIVTSTGTVTAGYGLGSLSERIAVHPGLGLLDRLGLHDHPADRPAVTVV